MFRDGRCVTHKQKEQMTIKRKIKRFIKRICVGLNAVAKLERNNGLTVHTKPWRPLAVAAAATLVATQANAQQAVDYGSRNGGTVYGNRDNRNNYTYTTPYQGGSYAVYNTTSVSRPSWLEWIGDLFSSSALPWLDSKPKPPSSR